MQIGSWRRGKQIGFWRYYYESGKLEQEGNFKDGAFHGEWKLFDKNGKMKEKVF